MATGKKFYWIKLKKDFMNGDVVDFLMSQKDGAHYVVLYQMLCIMCINTNGELSKQIGEVTVPFDIEKIQRDCKYFDTEVVAAALELFKKLNLIYEQDNGVLAIRNFDTIVGSESDYAIQKRKQRQKRGQNEDNSVENVHTPAQTDGGTEAKEEKTEEKPPEEKPKRSRKKKDEPEKAKYAEFVRMTEEEYGKLVEKVGEEKTRRAIEILDNYKGSKGKSYKDDYRAILSWVIERVEEEFSRRGGNSGYGNFGRQAAGSPGDFKPSGGFKG